MQEIWIQISIGVLVLATGVAWGTLTVSVKGLGQQLGRALTKMETLQTKTDTNTTNLAVLTAIVKDRTEREG